MFNERTAYAGYLRTFNLGALGGVEEQHAIDQALQAGMREAFDQLDRGLEARG